MKETDELQPQQYEDLYWQESIPVKDVRKSTLRKFVYLGTLLCIAFILIGVFVKFSDQVELPFVFKSKQSEDIFRFPTSVYVLEKYIKSGDVIKKDQPLIKITSPEIVVMINNYREAEQELQNFEQQKILSVEKQKEIIAMQIKQNESKISQVQNEMSFLTNTWKSNKTHLEYEYDKAIEKYETNKGLLDEKVIAKSNLTEFEKNKMAATDALTSASLGYEKEKNRLASLTRNYQLENITANAELNKLIIDTKYSSIVLNNQFLLAKDKIKNTFGNFEISDGAITLLANEKGTISYIFDGEKEVSPGSIMLKIMYNQSPLYASIICPPSMIGKIKKGQKAALKIASFPFYEWGTAKGHIDNLSLTPDEKGSFSVNIVIDDYGKLNHLSQIGMTGNASIVLEEKTFYDYFFRKLKKTYYKATMPE